MQSRSSSVVEVLRFLATMETETETETVHPTSDESQPTTKPWKQSELQHLLGDNFRERRRSQVARVHFDVVLLS